MRRKSGLDSKVSECQGPQTAASRALAIPELLELVLDDKYLVCKNLQFRLVNRLWNATCQATVLRSVTVDEANIRILDEYSNSSRIVTILLDKEPRLAYHVKVLYSDLLRHPLDNDARAPHVGGGQRLLAQILPYMTCLRDLTLYDTATQGLLAMAPAMGSLRTLKLEFGREDHSHATGTDICNAMARCRTLGTLSVGYNRGHFDRKSRLHACERFFKLAGEHLHSLTLWLYALQAELLHKVSTAIGLQCPVLNSLKLRLYSCDDRKLESFKPLFTNTLKKLTFGVDHASGLTAFLDNLVDPAFLPSLEPAPALLWFESLSGSIPLATVEKALRALHQRNNTMDLTSMRAGLYSICKRQSEGQ